MEEELKLFRRQISGALIKAGAMDESKAEISQSSVYQPVVEGSVMGRVEGSSQISDLTDCMD